MRVAPAHAGEYNNANYIQRSFYDQVVKEQNYYSLPADLIETRSRNVRQHKLKAAPEVDGLASSENPLEVLSRDPQFKGLFAWRRKPLQAPARRSQRRRGGSLEEASGAAEQLPRLVGEEGPPQQQQELEQQAPVPAASTVGRLFVKKARQ